MTWVSAITPPLMSSRSPSESTTCSSSPGSPSLPVVPPSTPSLCSPPPSPPAAFARIPAQVLGSIIGVLLLRRVFPEIGHGLRLNVGIHHGALTEGLLTFFIVVISLGLKRKDLKSFFIIKTWISSVSKGALHILGSDLTGGIMNPASSFGWAFARGDHITQEYLLVYWVAPIHAALLGMWTFRLFTETGKTKETRDELKKAKSE